MFFRSTEGEVASPGEPTDLPGSFQRSVPPSSTKGLAGSPGPPPSSLSSALKGLEELERETRFRASVLLTREAVICLRERTLAERESPLRDRSPLPSSRDVPRRAFAPRAACPETSALIADARRELTALSDALAEEGLKAHGLGEHCSKLRDKVRGRRADQLMADKQLAESRQQIVDAILG